MELPALSNRQGLEVTHAAPPNGYFAVAGETSRYTLVFDVLYPSGSDGRFQTDFTSTLVRLLP